jgi:iron complex transport system substrate-binding protein
LDQKLKGIKDVGDVFNPSVEKILTLDPDIVIGWTTQEQDITNQLQQAGIPVVLLDCSKTDVLSRDIKVIGKILGREKRASQFIAYYEKYQEMIGTRLKGVPDEKKPQVYWEGMSDYNTVGPGSSDGNMLVAAGGRNIAGEVPLSSTKVSPEWVLVKNPEIVIKCPGTAKVPSGYGINADAMKKQREEIIVRSELKQIKAFKTDKVYVLSRRAVSGPQSIIGLMYVAKWLHPELFEDVNPEKIHQEMLEKFYGLEYQGAWAYPI